MMKTYFSIFTLNIFFLLISFYGISSDFKQINTYYYGPNLSQNEACRKSLNIAKRKALEKNYEKIDSQSFLFCSDSDKLLCDKLENIWSQTNGVIKNLKVLNKTVGYDKKFKSNYCKIEITGFILTPHGKIDPNLDFSLKLKKETLRNKENLKVLITPSVPMYFNIFYLTLIVPEVIMEILKNTN